VPSSSGVVRTKENCPYDQLPHEHAISRPTPAAVHEPIAHTLLNSGLVVLHPSKQTTQKKVQDLLASTAETDQAKIKSWMFPDQDLLADLFRGKWIALPWIYNAIKTMRYWHGTFWRDQEVKNLHYICDKPWKRRPEKDHAGSGKKYAVNAGKYTTYFDGELGLPAEEADAITHGWWWEEYEDMRDAMVKDGYKALAFLDSLVAK